MNLTSFKDELKEKCQLIGNRPLVVGVSGGPDSLCLLDLLVKINYPLRVAHFNHHLRAEAGEDAQKVGLYCEQKAIPFLLGEADVARYAQENKLSIEEAARICRYRFLFNTARQEKAEAVAVAHSADDQVETVLMHLIRGAGLAGLKGMAYRSVLVEWDDQIPLVRPLLSFWRDEIQTYISENGLEPVIDLSNNDTTYFRNRLRHELIPYLSAYNPQIKKSIWRTAQSLEGDYEILNGIIQETWQNVVFEQDLEAVVLNWPQLEILEAGLKRNIFRKAIQLLIPSLRDVDFESIERISGFMDHPSRSGRQHLLADIWIEKSENRLIIGRRPGVVIGQDWPAIADGQRVNCPLNGEIQLSSGWKIKLETLQGDIQREMINRDKNQAWFDLDGLAQPVRMRSWENGDRFRPLGMGGRHIKLSDFFINQHVPLAARKNYPLICSGDEIIWVPGIRPSEFGRLENSSKNILRLQLVQS